MKTLEDIIIQHIPYCEGKVEDKDIEALAQAILKHLREVAKGMKKPVKSAIEYGCDIHQCGMDDGYNLALTDFLERIEKPEVNYSIGTNGGSQKCFGLDKND